MADNSLVDKLKGMLPSREKVASVLPANTLDNRRAKKIDDAVDAAVGNYKKGGRIGYGGHRPMKRSG